MLKKAIAVITTMFLVSSCNMNFVNNNIPETQGNINLKGFSIKSTTNPNDVKKVFLGKQRLGYIEHEKKDKNRDTDKNREKNVYKYTFNVNDENDLKRKFIFNIVNGLNNENRARNIEVKINGNTIIYPHSREFDNISEPNLIYKKLCESQTKSKHEKDENEDEDDFKSQKNKVSCDILFKRFFNKKTDSLSVWISGIKLGLNTLEVKIKDDNEKSTLDIELDGFMDPLNIPNAINSKLWNPNRDLKYKKGAITVKFTEGMKVRLIKDSKGKNHLVDLNGISLTSFENYISTLGTNAKFFRVSNESYDFFDKMESDLEAEINKDVGNMNLFYVVAFDETMDAWKIIDELKKLPYVEEAFPEFDATLPSYNNNASIGTPNDTFFTDGTEANRGLSSWLTKIRVMDPIVKSYNPSTTGGPSINTYIQNHCSSDQKGAWRFTNGDPNTGTAIFDSFFEHSDLGLTYRKLGDSVETNKELDSTRITAINNVKDTVPKSHPYDIFDIFHGTAAAGIIGANGDNNDGTAGISFNSKLLLVRSYSASRKASNDENCENITGGGNSKGLGFFTPDEKPFSNMLDSISIIQKNSEQYKWVKSLVLELEVGSEGVRGSASLFEDSPINRLYLMTLIFVLKKNVILPAGNNFDTDISVTKMEHYVLDPVTLYEKVENTEIGRVDIGTIIVGGLNDDGTDVNVVPNDSVSEYNYGVSTIFTNALGYKETITHGTDVSAPAGKIFTIGSKKDVDYKYCSLRGTENNYFNFTGTSAAMPQIAGVINLLYSVNPTLTPNQVREILRETAQKELLNFPTKRKIAPMVNAYEAVKRANSMDGGLNLPEKTDDFTCSNLTTKSIKNSAGVDVPVVTNGAKIEVKAGDQIAIPITPSIKNQLSNVYIGGIQLTLLQIVQNHAIYNVPDLGASSSIVTSSLIDIVIKNNLGQTVETLADALKILLDAITQTKGFPSSITVNGVTTNLDYGFNFDFNELSGNTVFDSSGKNNNGEFATLHGLLPVRVNNEAINFQAGSYITVPYSPSYNLPRKFAFLTTMKLHEKNRQQTILQKWEDQQINGQIVNSYHFYLDSTNKITLTLSDNKSNYFSITHNADLPFDLEKEVGIAVIVDLDAKTVKMVKNQTIVDGNILYDGSWYHYNSLDQFGSIRNSTIRAI